jgi:hypothetical protein
MNRKLEEARDEYLASDYLRIEKDSEHQDSELWRISLRLGALNNVDYGQFVSELKRVVEPILTSYRYRDYILREVDKSRDGKGFVKARVAFLGLADPESSRREVAAPDQPADAASAAASTDTDGASPTDAIDQTRLFAQTLRDLMTCAGVYAKSGCWHDPDSIPVDQEYYTSDEWSHVLENTFDCVVLVNDHPHYDLDFIKQHSRVFIDARGHEFDPANSLAATAVDMDAAIQVVYTGIVPIVYKAQRTLLASLIDSIGWAFVMIALVMMLLLRGGASRWAIVNVRGGMIAMIPNVFPVVLIFGAMGHMRILVDIGTMMTASVAMGVAVDDTIHFLTWFRKGMSQGLPRNEAILTAYKRCAAAMTQTTLIGGFGLAVFAFSTFTPTQCFGIMMLALLAAALIGDLVFLPALLASPLGRYFCPRVPANPQPAAQDRLEEHPNPTPDADGGDSGAAPAVGDGTTDEARQPGYAGSVLAPSKGVVEPPRMLREDSTHQSSQS